MSIGLEHGKNRLVPYSPDWPERFAAESKKVANVCSEHILAIEHIGSTSISGMTAKPIVDMVVGVKALSVAEEMVSGMASVGYDYPGDIGISGDRIFGRDPGFRKYLIHTVVLNSPEWNRYITFRDALREDLKLAKKYCQLKERIVREYPEGRSKYTERKSDFILQVLEGM